MTNAANEQLAQAEAFRLARKETRRCDGCTECCTILGVVELHKPMMTRCRHEMVGGCSVYAHRPETCAEFLCLWREGWGTDEMRPDKCGFMLWVQEQPEVYRYAQGFDRVPPLVVVAYEAEAGALGGEQFAVVRRNLLAACSVLMEFHDATVRLFGMRFPEGQNVRTRAQDGDSTKLRILIPND